MEIKTFCVNDNIFFNLENVVVKADLINHGLKELINALDLEIYLR